MTTDIKDIADLVRIMKEQPEWADTLRGVLLGQELLELPGKFDAFVAMQTETNRQMTEAIQQLAGAVQKNTEAIQALVTHARIVDERLDKIGSDLSNLTTRFNRMDNDFGRFRGAYTRTAMERSTNRIADSVSQFHGLISDESEIVSITYLPADDIRALARRTYGAERLRDIPSGDRQSLYEADRVIRIETDTGHTYYIAIQASHTCDLRDTTNAIRNARLLSLFTGRDAYPVIAGVRFYDEIQPQIDSGEVFWYEIEDRHLRPDEPN